MSGAPVGPGADAREAYISMAVDTLQSALCNLVLVLGYFRQPPGDDGAKQWEAICGELRIYASGASELLARVLTSEHGLDAPLFDLATFQETDVARVAGKGYALLLAGLALHVGNELGGTGYARTNSALAFIEGQHRRLLRQLATVGQRHR